MSGNAQPTLQFEWVVDDKSTTILFDASVEEVYEGSAQIPDHPVETGQSINDNIRPMPDMLKLQAMVSNTPIIARVFAPTSTSDGSVKRLSLPPGQKMIGIPTPQPGPANTLQFDTQFNRVQDIATALLEAKNAGALILVTTSLKSYTNYAIEHVTVPRDAQHANASVLSIELKQIRFVEVTETAAAPTAQKKQQGHKETRVADKQTEDTQKKSFAASGSDFLFK